MTVTAQHPLARVVPYRPRRDAPARVGAPLASIAPVAPLVPVTPTAPTVAPTRQDSEPRYLIHIDGHDLLARESMAEMFLRKAGRIVAEGAAELVPLLHEDGVELLFVSPSTVLRITRP